MHNDGPGGWRAYDPDRRGTDGFQGRISPPSDTLRKWVLAIYGAYLLAAVSAGVVALLGVIAAYVKRDESRGTLWESHFDNQIRTFWISLLLLIIAVPLSLVFIGWIVWAVMLVYYLWKSTKGAIRALDRQPYH